MGFCDSILKEYIDYDKLKEKGDTFQELFKEGLSLNKKALLITTGLHLILETNALEDKGIDLWFSIVQATHLPMVQDIALFAVDIPIFIKELGRVYMHNQFRRDSFFNFKVKRIILCRKYPDDVAEFRDGLVHLRYARTSILDHLNQISALKTQVKENWSEESEQIRKGSRLLQKSSFSLQGKLQKERNERGLIRTFIV
ncbi:MAG: hypothetical protein KDK71_09730 [Chlamydiia bacterium]|nr:hypothetical protein [Chlamydiia bacterium]